MYGTSPNYHHEKQRMHSKRRERGSSGHVVRQRRARGNDTVEELNSTSPPPAEISNMLFTGPTASRHVRTPPTGPRVTLAEPSDRSTRFWRRRSTRARTEGQLYKPLPRSRQILAILRLVHFECTSHPIEIEGIPSIKIAKNLSSPVYLRRFP